MDEKPDGFGIAGKILFALGVAAVLGVIYVAWRGIGIIGFLLTLPLLAWFASRLLVHGSTGAVGWINRQAVSEWQGRYYAFNDVQVRVLEEGGQLWFVARDVLQALGINDVADSLLARMQDDARVLEESKLTALNAAGVRKLLASRRDHETGRFLLWMEREVLHPWEKKRERAKLER